ncbi:MAG TPA: ABC transporter substrate-binding protein [Feifaniaceae bacterium]|nr:ABC transporter substrate-binding protein [Feifaniaceae bacterium]
MKKTVLMLLVIAMVLSAFACAPEQASQPQPQPEASAQPAQTEAPEEAAEPAKTDEDLYVAFISKAYAGDFWKTVQLGAETAGQDLGIKLTYEGCDTEASIDQQVNLVENAVNKGADAICIAALDTEGMVPVVESAAAKGVKIVTYNSILASDVAVSHVATDNYVAGGAAAEKMGELLGGKGKIVVIGTSDAAQGSVNRCNGFADKMAELYPEVEIISIQYAQGDLNRAIAIATDSMTANPDLAGIFANNDITSIGAGTAIIEKNMKGKLVFVGFDACEQNISYLNDGVMQGFVSQDPFMMAYQAVEAAYKALKNEPVEANIETKTTFVTLDNINDENVVKLLYPYGKN